MQSGITVSDENLMTIQRNKNIMSISVEIPGPLLQKIERLKNKPDEGPVEVISRPVYYYNQDDELTPEETEAVKIGLEENEKGKTISHEELGKKLGFI